MGVPVADYLTLPKLNRTLNLDTHKKLLDLEVTISLDTWGIPITNDHFFMADDFERQKALFTLRNLGYEDQITLGNDFSSKIMGRSYRNYSCIRFVEFTLPMLKRLGREALITKLVVDTPR